MKKHINLLAKLIIVALIVFLPIWRIWPRSLSDLFSFDEKSIEIVSVSAQILNINAPGQSHYEHYSLKDMKQKSNMSKEIVDILSTTEYREDFRNLWPWGLKSITANRNYDGRHVILSFNIKNEKGEFGHINYTTSNLITIQVMSKLGMCVYHPTNSETLDVLVEYIKEHGVKE